MKTQNSKWTSRLGRLPLLAIAVVPATVLVLAAVASAQSVKARYPYDPACAWGRIGNGKGMLVRCLTEAEAVALVKGADLPAKDPQKPEPAPAASSETAPPAAESSENKPLKVEVGPITADKGKLSVGRLHVPTDRYAACVKDHGGLAGPTGEVHVRFLVRGEASRAEGVSVSKRRNLSAEAAKCIADVVDRRKVGTPEAPMVGATLVISFSQ